jgi:hypothetical protein
MDINSQKKQILMGIGATCLNLAVLLGGAWILTGKIIDSSKKLNEKKTYIEEIHRGWEKMKDEGQLKDISSSVKLYENSFFSKENPLLFINEIEFYAQQTGNFFDINFISSGDKKDENTFSFRVSLLGGFQDLMRFLRCMENMNYYVQIEQIQIARVEAREAAADKDARAGDVRSSIILSAFIR